MVTGIVTSHGGTLQSKVLIDATEYGDVSAFDSRSISQRPGDWPETMGTHVLRTSRTPW